MPGKTRKSSQVHLGSATFLSMKVAVQMNSGAAELSRKSTIRSPEINTSQTHFLLFSEDTSEVFSCAWCKATFPSDSEGIEHVCSKPQFVCDICQKAYVRLYHYENHQRSHDLARQIKCSACAKTFCSEARAKCHWKKAHKGRYRSCKTTKPFFKKLAENNMSSSSFAD